MRHPISLAALTAILCAVAGFVPARAHACGGLFCNSSQPVNQAAERILFVTNGDGTVTAVIEIQYEGPSEKFSWVLPVPGEPEVAVSSTTAFDRLQQRTNPQFMLQTTFAEGCGGRKTATRGPAASFDDAESGAGESPVTVLAMGTVGPFDYQVISVDPSTDDPADAAVTWLEEEGYDVTTLGPEVLGPYLANGLNLIAFRLTKTSSTGSIRPIVITYESERPFIPIKPTAVAANDDMGVLVWVGGTARAIPDNYKALEINEARIDWFNPMSTYNDVVSEAADEAGGQGFVTELAAKSDTLKQVIVQDFEEQEWQRISSADSDGVTLFMDAINSGFSSWDGFGDALKSAVKLPQGVDIDDLIGCPNCYADDPGLMIDAASLRKALYEQVYKPMADTEALLQSRPYVTRLYTTMSASEMNLDPSFDFNSDVGDVSNVHMAMQTLSCDDSWKIALPQGDTVYGEEAGVWPMGDMKEQPAARLIIQMSTSGKGMVVEDNSKKIAQLLRTTGAAQARMAANDDGCAATGTGGSEGSGSSAMMALLALGLIARRRRPGAH